MASEASGLTGTGRPVRPAAVAGPGRRHKVEEKGNLYKAHQLRANLKKCSFVQSSVEYLRHVVSQEGVVADETKIEAMQKWPMLRNIRELRGFLELTGYYRRFVRGYNTIAWLLTEQLKNDNFLWGETATQAFERLKKAMTTIPLLAILDFN
ncbi:uncharacterized protein LOC110112567 [Dendrobium catenatum]|uniref:uncharacterized protein LOC110112567 n=1 Tax=Dendrobium catenatum TaxID=906689 RepID=UPI0009F1D859|nr:uncharacterized protein LOC110112567 [Dendrobium catenatum]